MSVSEQPIIRHSCTANVHGSDCAVSNAAAIDGGLMSETTEQFIETVDAQQLGELESPVLRLLNRRTSDSLVDLYGTPSAAAANWPPRGSA